jgi:hypothetical protein
VARLLDEVRELRAEINDLRAEVRPLAESGGQEPREAD